MSPMESGWTAVFHPTFCSLNSRADDIMPATPVFQCAHHCGPISCMVGVRGSGELDEVVVAFIMGEIQN